MHPLTLIEAAAFLRLSKSTLYQRKDIPRYRLPNSRALLFDREELEQLLKQGRTGGITEGRMDNTPVPEVHETSEDAGLVDISSQHVYHRNARYR